MCAAPESFLTDDLADGRVLRGASWVWVASMLEPPSKRSRWGPGVAEGLTTVPLGRPIRVVLFAGAFRAVRTRVRSVARRASGGAVPWRCLSEPGIRASLSRGRRRCWRKLLAPVVLAVYATHAALRFARRPRAELALRRRVRAALARVVTVPDIHAPSILEQVRLLSADLGLVYGAPVLKPQLFEIPAFGTLGIHHGKLPRYRGMKTTFWAMLNGEQTAGVTIQKINAGVDTGDVVCAGEVPLQGKRYGRVDAEVQALGLTLYLAAIVAVKRGEAFYRSQEQGGVPCTASHRRAIFFGSGTDS